MPASAPLPTGYRVDLPPWLLAEQQAIPERLTDAAERIRLVNRLAARTVAEGTGGPFAALVVERGTGEVVAAGVNLVLHSNLATAHAEVVALSLAQTRTGHWNLAGKGAERMLVVNAQPCVMCLGALIWSGVRAVEVSATSADVVSATGFDEGPVPADWQAQLEQRGIAVATGLLRDESLAVLRDFRRQVEQGQAVLYNGG